MRDRCDAVTGFASLPSLFVLRSLAELEREEENLLGVTFLIFFFRCPHIGIQSLLYSKLKMSLHLPIRNRRMHPVLSARPNDPDPL